MTAYMTEMSCNQLLLVDLISYVLAHQDLVGMYNVLLCYVYLKQLIGLTLLHQTTPPLTALLSYNHTVLHTPLGALSFSDTLFVDLGTKSQTIVIPSTHSPPATRAATSSLKCTVRKPPIYGPTTMPNP